mmetsp:Transcript_18856/g.38825  ORF Transcript_18856/g.38825 Transcript_18856/m.38825 type:complete len:294 (+) Transcript_18856:89-970(+)
MRTTLPYLFEPNCFQAQQQAKQSRKFCRPYAMDHLVKDINESSKYILGGDYATSIFLLTKALKKTKLIISLDAIETFAPTDRQSNDCNENKQEDPDRFKSPGDALEYDFFDMAPENFLNTSVPVQEGGFCKFRRVSVFATPLTVKGDLFGVSLDAPLCHDLSCVVIYNLALSHQLQAITLFKSAEENEELALHYLKKAMSLYQICQQMFKKHSTQVRDPALHCMGLVSNLGQIHHLNGDSQKARECNEYLLSVLMYTIDRSKGESPYFDHLVLDGFLCIVEHLISDDCTTPAA